MEKLTKVLLIDDEPVIAKLIPTILGTENFQFTVTDNSDDSIKLLSTNCPDVVILDLKLRNSDGFTVLKKIREIDKTIPVIILTGNSDKGAAIRAIKDGAFEYIEKPFEDEDLCHAIDKSLEFINLNKQVNRAKKVEGVSSMIITYNHRLHNALANAYTYFNTEGNPEPFRELAKKGLDDALAILDEIKNISPDEIEFENYFSNKSLVKLNCTKD